MLFPVHPQNPEKRKIKQISEKLLEGAVYIFPTDTVYAIAADATSVKAIDKFNAIRNNIENQPLTLLCKDISEASNYIVQFSNEAFKIMKHCTPGPYIFLIKANKNVSKSTLVNPKTRTLGIRISENIFLRDLLEFHPNPIIMASVVLEHEFIEEPEMIDSLLGKKVEAVVDGGRLVTELTTIIDFQDDVPVIIREGKGMDRLVGFNIG